MTVDPFLGPAHVDLSIIDLQKLVWWCMIRLNTYKWSPIKSAKKINEHAITFQVPLRRSLKVKDPSRAAVLVPIVKLDQDDHPEDPLCQWGLLYTKRTSHLVKIMVTVVAVSGWTYWAVMSEIRPEVTICLNLFSGGPSYKVALWW